MSKAAVLQLIEAAESNSELLKKLHNSQGPEAVIEIASKLGYEFSKSELLDVMQEKQLSFASNELSDEQLEAVVGGKGGSNNSNPQNEKKGVKKKIEDKLNSKKWSGLF